MFLKKINKPCFFYNPKLFFSKEGISNSSKNPLYDTYRTFHNIALDKLEIPGITIVKTKDAALRAVNILQTVRNRFNKLY